jgi:hypothetical protein
LPDVKVIADVSAIVSENLAELCFRMLTEDVSAIISENLAELNLRILIAVKSPTLFQKI